MIIMNQNHCKCNSENVNENIIADNKRLFEQIFDF